MGNKATVSEAFDPRRYWDQRHERTSGLDGVGYLGLRRFNDWMYRVRTRVLRRTLERHRALIRGARVLDIGAGTGFALVEWMRYEPREMAAVDISEVACARLHVSFPEIAVHCVDVADASDEQIASLGSFDFISMMDVLFHLVDDEKYARALQRIARMLTPDGRLIFTENFLRDRPRRGNAWAQFRTLSQIEALFANAGLSIEQRVPMFVLMNQPADSSSRLLAAHWATVSRLARRSAIASDVMGAALYPMERLLTRIMAEGPSTELAVSKKRNS
jgi:SAM-dependent methyltransferase